MESSDLKQYKEIGVYLKLLKLIDYSNVYNEKEYIELRLARFALYYKYIKYYTESNKKSELIDPRLVL